VLLFLIILSSDQNGLVETNNREDVKMSFISCHYFTTFNRLFTYISRPQGSSFVVSTAPRSCVPSQETYPVSANLVWNEKDFTRDETLNPSPTITSHSDTIFSLALFLRKAKSRRHHNSHALTPRPRRWDEVIMLSKHIFLGSLPQLHFRTLLSSIMSKNASHGIIQLCPSKIHAYASPGSFGKREEVFV
jgi:hypothetical protein